MPRGWKDRLVEVKSPSTASSIGLCLDPLDLCVAKLVAGREKDWSFVDSLVGAGLVNPTNLEDRVELLDDGQSQKDGPIINKSYRDRLHRWIKAAKARHATVWP